MPVNNECRTNSSASFLSSIQFSANSGTHDTPSAISRLNEMLEIDLELNEIEANGQNADNLNGRMIETHGFNDAASVRQDSSTSTNFGPETIFSHTQSPVLRFVDPNAAVETSLEVPMNMNFHSFNANSNYFPNFGQFVSSQVEQRKFFFDLNSLSTL